MHNVNKPGLFSQIFAAILLLAVTAVHAQSEEPVMVYRKPDVDLKIYTRILISPLDLSVARIVPPAWVANPNPREWELTEDRRKAMAEAFAASTGKGAAESGQYKVVDSHEAGTLQVDFSIISLTPWAVGGEKVETLGTGQLTFEARVRDARTAELLAVFQGTQQVGQEYQENTPAAKLHGLSEHFAMWGRRVATRLAAAQAEQTQ